jgi:phage-related tail fiber protein
MAEAITTNRYRQRLARAMAGSVALKPIKFMAFGDGGHDPATLKAVAPNPDQTALNHELLRKPLSAITHEDAFSVTGTGAVDYSELIGRAISEAALIDSDGEIVGIKNFAPKIKEGDERYETSVKLRF